MRIRVLALAALMAMTTTAHACINVVGTDHTGRKFNPGGYAGAELSEMLTQPQDKRYWSLHANHIIAKAVQRPNYATLTELGVLLVFQGQYTRAVNHFLMLERRYPGRYETATNLGTALELSGHDEPALRWIRIGIQRNPESHGGSEWLHVRILDAKIAAARDPAYLASHSIAGVTFAPVRVPPVPQSMPAGNNGAPVLPWELDNALANQLLERVQFVSPKDPVVANLLLDWATLNLAGGPIESADVLYDLAVRYGAPRDALMRERQAFVRATLRTAPKIGESNDYRCAICQPMD